MSTRTSDEQLVAYLDNQLDAEQRSRIDAAIIADPMLGLRLQWLDRSSLPFKDAYDELARQAPVDRLQAMLATLPSPVRPGLNRRWFLAAAAALLAGGVLADRLFLGWQASRLTHNWRGEVADYMALYVPQTLDHLPADEAAQRASVDARGQAAPENSSAPLLQDKPVFDRARIARLVPDAASACRVAGSAAQSPHAAATAL